ncbi:GNAT family N-acetyltransferase [Jeotgalibacillus aurantiacus]|uniref:GNAT family N-acetyltransferase n=1 Tax=Jeotgalibacillus aurantiacus TaxID=2763266 RepID=UPI001D0BB5F0|nr:GNAT family N-acetyltransferase [Jeotgalibacillus aurantiacus]
MVFVRKAEEKDIHEMTAIYNQAVADTVATFDLKPHTLEQRKEWFSRYQDRYPLIVAEKDGRVAGYCSLSPFRDKEAYMDTVELSIYISPEFQGAGIGKKLMQAILGEAKNRQFHVVIGGITGGNEASVRLHERFGFEFVGNFKQVGFKFGEWQDVHFYQLILN